MTIHILIPPDAPALPPLPGATVSVRSALPPAASLPPDSPVVLLLSPTWRADAAAAAGLADRAALVAIGSAEQASVSPLQEHAMAWLPPTVTPAVAARLLTGACRHAEALAAALRRHDELQELTRIGAALSTERDLTALLRLILSQARRLARADAGSLYLVERAADRSPVALRFALAQNHTLPDLPFHASTMALDATSLAGYVALSGEPLVIDDAYALDDAMPYRFNRSFDDAVGYRTRSMLVLPMRTHRDEIVGVLQLINRKHEGSARLPDADALAAQVLPFDTASVELVGALASQAAVAIENGRLYEDIERLFEGFVAASVHAIEQRDPTTSGHSFRVTAYTMGLAHALNEGLGLGPYVGTRFDPRQLRELRYACLLHDFGKVAVREAVLQKQKKLYPTDLEVIRHRFLYLMQALDIAAERERVDHLLSEGPGDFAAVNTRIEAERQHRRDALHHMLDTILRANEPSVMAEGAAETLLQMAHETYVDSRGVELPLLSADELAFLSIGRGNLDRRERREIEAHAQHSYDFLQRIPWTPELRDIPEIVWGHHEKLNGSGYPRGVGATDLVVQTRMMTIADIFDALVASDRPYKRALPVERAVAILRDEARQGALDSDLLETFIAAEIWVRVADEVATRTREAQEATPRFSVPVRAVP